MENEKTTFVKWKDRETEDPYEIFDKLVHEKVRKRLVSSIKVYVKSEPAAEDITRMKTRVHIYDSRDKKTSFVYECETDPYLTLSNGSCQVGEAALAGYKEFILSRYFVRRSNNGTSL